MSQFDIASDTIVVYQGDSSLFSFGRSSSGGQWFKLTAADDAQFVDALNLIKGNTPVYVTIGVADNLMIDKQEMLLTAVAGSSRSASSMKLQLDQPDADFYDLCGKWRRDNTELYVLIIAGEYEEKVKTEQGQYKDLSKKIRKSPLLTNLNFLEKVGSEEKFISWIQKQPCVLSGSFWHNPETGEELNEAAHIREISQGAGTGIKPRYRIVPLHYKLHRWQHDHSMTELWMRNSYSKGCPRNKHYRRLSPYQEYPIRNVSHAAHSFFHHKTESYMRGWVEHEIITWVGVDRLSHVSEEKLDRWLAHVDANEYVGVI